MLDYAKLIAPAENGEIRIEPGPAGLVDAARANSAQLKKSHVRVLDRPLAEWRVETRGRFGVAAQRLAIITGHQPAFIHPGVWAKNVVASRLAAALKASAINLVVDQDAPQGLVWDIPVVSVGGLSVRQVAIAHIRSGQAYESIPAQSPEEIDRLESQVRDALGDRWAGSAMPLYFEGFRALRDPAGWVDQAVAGRREVDRSIGVRLADHRVSTAWWLPLRAELLLNAGRFAASYNAALAEYRRDFKVRGANRPIPDLLIEPEIVELPLWAYRQDGLRFRIGVRSREDRIALIVRGETIAVFSRAEIPNLQAADLDLGGWLIRPRALTLTLWARLFLADLFIHGIGGAKYDRITDSIIRSYFGIDPPPIACVSATLRLGLPVTIGPMPERIRFELRDLQWNPQRHVTDGRVAGDLISRRAAAVERAGQLREGAPANHRARREVFHVIRDLNRQILETAPEVARRLAQAAAESKRTDEQRKIAAGREYFFALYPQAELLRLVKALPGERDFGV